MPFRLYIGTLAFLALLAIFLPASASARYLSYGAAYRAALLDTFAAEREVTGLGKKSSLGICTRVRLGSFQCPVWLKQDTFVRIVREPPYPAIYRHLRCDWTAYVHWRGPRVVANRLGLQCFGWEDETKEQP